MTGNTGATDRLAVVLAESLTDLVRGLGATPVRAAEPGTPTPTNQTIAAVARFGNDRLRGTLTLMGDARVFRRLGPQPPVGDGFDVADWARELASQAAGRLRNRLLAHNIALAAHVPVDVSPREVVRMRSRHPLRIPEVVEIDGLALEAWLEVEFPSGFVLPEPDATTSEQALLEGSVRIF